jgi:1,4-alpha-glucan branching enzyme
MDEKGHEIEAIVNGTDGDVASRLLGPRPLNTGGVRILAFVPGADGVTVMPDNPAFPPRAMEAWYPGGLFGTEYPDASAGLVYRLQIEEDGDSYVERDPYAFAPQISDLDLLTIGEGTNVQAYEVLGARPCLVDGTAGVRFAVWAPHARWVGVIGDFNQWHPRRHPCRKRGPGGIWELFIPGLAIGAHYKFHIESAINAYSVDKADPFAYQAEVRPSTASVVADVTTFDWHDADWLRERPGKTALDQPMLIYEVHAGSWKRSADGSMLNYRVLAHDLVSYVKEMGYTHIELMPITEHPFDVSWGYQTTGYYAPTSRFGTPADFAYFVDYCHQHGVGVFVDWVPSHFAKEGHGLGFFDGAHLYEHADPRQGEHLDWGTFVFNYGRGEVLTFLLSNAMFWLDRYHVDGFRLDAVASMLYLDHQRPAGAWVPNKYGGRENLEAVAFLRRFNELVNDRFPGVVTMAEESTSWPMVSKPSYLGGLGFTLKWNMGWMHDALEYVKSDPIMRRFHHNSITFSILYTYSEHFLLPLSHDEVVHGKSPLVYKAPGDEWQKFASLRLLLGYMWAHPGKKLLFMGGDIAQTQEWNFDAELRWDLLRYPMHQAMRQWVRDLNALYAAHPEFYELDYDPAGFEWIDCRDVDNSILIMMRKGRPSPDGDQDPEARRPFSIVACNFTPVVRHGYVVGVPRPGSYSEVLNSDDRAYGGSGVINEGNFGTRPQPMHGRDQSIVITLPPLAVLVLQLIAT